MERPWHTRVSLGGISLPVEGYYCQCDMHMTCKLLWFQCAQMTNKTLRKLIKYNYVNLKQWQASINKGVSSGGVWSRRCYHCRRFHARGRGALHPESSSLGWFYCSRWDQVTVLVSHSQSDIRENLDGRNVLTEGTMLEVVPQPKVDALAIISSCITSLTLYTL